MNFQIWEAGNSIKFDYEFIEDAFNITESGVKLDDGNPMFTYCPVSHNGELKSFDEPYHKNGKVRMDNHPLMIMALQKRRVRKVEKQAAVMNFLKHGILF